MNTNLTGRFSSNRTITIREEQIRNPIVLSPWNPTPSASTPEDVETAILLEFEEDEEWPT